MTTISWNSSDRVTQLEPLMPPRQMTLQVEVTPSPKLRSRKRVSDSVASSCWLTWQVVSALKIAWAITKIDKQKELRLTSLFLVSRNALEPLMPREVKHLRASIMFHSVRANLPWFSEIPSWRVRKSKLWCSHAFAQEWVLLTILWIL